MHLRVVDVDRAGRPTGRLDDGVSVYVLAGEELVLNETGVPVGHSSEKAPAVTLTGSEKLIVTVELGATVELFVGTVLVTVATVSTVNENT